MILAQNQCTSCKPGAPLATKQEISEMLPEIPEWQILEIDGINQLVRCYKLKNFVSAMVLTQKIADVAESEGHHPALLTEWGKVTVSWWSHKIKGLHRNDFVMAAKTDQLYLSLES